MTNTQRPQPRPIVTNTLRTPPKLTNVDATSKYLTVDLWSWLRNLYINMLKINFNDNFQGFYARNVYIPKATEVTLTNQFLTVYPGVIPTGRIITRQQGDALIIDGTNDWTAKNVYLLNTSPVNDAIITVFFFK